MAIHHSRLGVKEFFGAAPDIEVLRLQRCPCCAAPATPVGGSKQVIGHGIRSRTLVWRVGLGHRIEEVTIFVRRFLCTRCARTITVLPALVDAGRRYARDLIIFLLAAWSIEGETAADLRQLVGGSIDIDWPQLRRWAMGLRLPEGRRTGRGPPRRHAARVVQIYAGCAPPRSREGLSLAQRACNGAAYVR